MDPNSVEIKESLIPSECAELLRSLIGLRIVAMTRYSWDPPEIAMAENELTEAQLFSLTAGPILIEMDDRRIVGAASDPSLVSVTLWLERDHSGKVGPARVAEDPDFTPISGSDERYTPAAIRELIAKRIQSVTILQLVPPNARCAGRPCEVGVLIRCEGGGQVLFSHELHHPGDNFGVITPEMVLPEFADQLFVQQIFE